MLSLSCRAWILWARSHISHFTHRDPSLHIEIAFVEIKYWHDFITQEAYYIFIALIKSLFGIHVKYFSFLCFGQMI
jgi:hypothetical protein